MKRTLYQVSNCTRSKKPRLVGPLPPRTRRYFWVNATDTRNYLLRDPLVDYLKLTKVTPRNNNKPNEFFTFIMERGNEFEDRLVDYINKNKIPVVSVSNRITDKSCKKTIELMKQGVPIIHSAPFKNGKKHIRGIIDLLVRSDHLNDLVNDDPMPEHLKTHKAPNLNGNYHYVVVDVKFSTLTLRADGIHLLNSGSYPAYKGQLYIYTEGIGDIQGYQSPLAFILGRRWNYTKKGIKSSGISCLDKLGVINFEGVDKEYIKKTKDAMQWLYDLRKYGKNWVTYPPEREELYPNMCVDSGKWNKDKEEYANRLGEITQIWYCGVKHRQNAINQGVCSWKDLSCNSQLIGMGGTRASTIDKIIDINRQNVDKIRPKTIQTNLHNWRHETNEIFVDFETFCDVFADFNELPKQQKTNTIFMIGIYYKEGSKWVYKNFIAKKPTVEEEYRIMDSFINFIKQQGYPKMWYWHAENTIWKTAENRQMDVANNLNNSNRVNNILNNWADLNWVDLVEIFRVEPIVIKDCFKFGLKEVAKAMRNHGMIKSEITGECDSGLEAAVKAWNAYKTDDPLNSPILADISKYNKFDVEVLQEILQYLRKNN